MKVSIKVLILLFLTMSCSSSKNTPTPIVVVPKNEIKSVEYIINSDVGHKIKVELEYRVLTQNGSVEGCKVGYILTNIGNLDLKTGSLYEEKYLSREEVQRIWELNNKEHLKIINYNPEIVFEIKTSDGKTIEKIARISDDILVGNSSTPKEVNAKVSYASNRYCVSFKPIRIQGK